MNTTQCALTECNLPASGRYQLDPPTRLPGGTTGPVPLCERHRSGELVQRLEVAA